MNKFLSTVTEKRVETFAMVENAVQANILSALSQKRVKIMFITLHLVKERH